MNGTPTPYRAPGRTSDDSRRLRRVHIASEVLVGFLTQEPDQKRTVHTQCVAGLPDGAELVHVEMRRSCPRTDCLCVSVIVRHPSFDVVRAGYEPPLSIPAYRLLHCEPQDAFDHTEHSAAGFRL